MMDGLIHDCRPWSRPLVPAGCLLPYGGGHLGGPVDAATFTGAMLTRERITAVAAPMPGTGVENQSNHDPHDQAGHGVYDVHAAPSDVVGR